MLKIMRSIGRVVDVGAAWFHPQVRSQLRVAAIQTAQRMDILAQVHFDPVVLPSNSFAEKRERVVTRVNRRLLTVQ
jgi:hypothetical protein